MPNLGRKWLQRAILRKSCDDFNEIKLISPQPQDSDSHFSVEETNKETKYKHKLVSNSVNWTIKSLFLGLLYTKLVFAFVLLGFPILADASITSFFSSIFSGENIRKETLLSETNSQNLSILQAVPNSDPNASKGGGDIIVVGNEALLSETGPSGTTVDIEEGNSGGIISEYVVQRGDSISSIANMFNVSPNTIQWANDIKNGTYIKEGQTLIILPISGIKYTVKSGDNLKNIVSKYKGDLDEVIQYNNLNTDSSLSVGETIIIPNGLIESSAISSKTSNLKKGSSNPSYTGYYIRPIDGGRKSQGIHGYNGVDIATSVGTPILASASGNVILSKGSGWNGGYGIYVVIEHPNKTQTLYAHMVKNISYQGQYVAQGQIIGYVGSTGRSTGPHLHFEVRGAKNPF